MELYIALAKFETYLLTQRRAANNTYLAYKQDLNQLLLFAQKNGVASLDGVTPSLIKEFIYHLADIGVGPRSLARKIAALRAFDRYCIEHLNLAEFSAGLVAPRYELRLPAYCTAAETAQMLSCNNGEGTQTFQLLRDKVIVHLLYATGMRASELAALQLTDLRLDEGTILVQGKGSKMRSIPLVKEVCTLLNEYLQERKNQKVSGEQALFCSLTAERCRPISRQTIRIIVRKCARFAQLEKNITPHTLRHTLATHSLKEGWNIRAVQQLLGHEQVTTTQRYTHIEDEQLKENYLRRHPRAK